MMSRKEKKRGLGWEASLGLLEQRVRMADDDVEGKEKITFERVGDALIDLFHVTQR